MEAIYNNENLAVHPTESDSEVSFRFLENINLLKWEIISPFGQFLFITKIFRRCFWNLKSLMETEEAKELLIFAPPEVTKRSVVYMI